eukprot:Nitzschia sp. Nitz4//scaffold99_size76975//62655//63638//NITZ4_005583-RA/size76975-processed-gene-0.55-mRNA-1//1//CDS//3329560871//2161//frame0
MTKSGDEHSDSEEKIPVAKQATRSKRRNKPKDFPKRPLSAYNVFFKETREDILAKSKENDEPKVDFQTMAKEIAARWKTLGKQERDRVELLAQKDMLRYRDEVKAYEEEMVKKSRSQREAAAAEKELSSKRSAVEEAAAARSPETLDSERSVMERLSASVALGGGRLQGFPQPASLSLAGLGQTSSFSPASSLAQRSLLMQDHSQQSEMLQRQILLEQLKAVEAREMQLRRLQQLSMLQQQGESSLPLSAAAAGLTQLRPGGAAAGLGSLMGGSMGASMFGLGAPAPTSGLSGGGDLGHVYAQLREQALMNALMARNKNDDFQLNQK